MRCSSTAKESLLLPCGPADRPSTTTVDVVGEPRQRVIGGDIGDDGAKRGDGTFELLHRRGIVVGAHDQVELGAEIADRLVVAGELLGRGQRAQHFANFARGALDAGQRLAVDAALAVLVDAPRQRADFALDQFDRLTRHCFGDRVTNFRKFVAECGDRLFDIVGTPHRLDLARDLEELPFERGEIRPADAAGAMAAGAAPIGRRRCAAGAAAARARRVRSGAP